MATRGKKPDRQGRLLKLALRLIAQKCPRLVRLCYWAGTSAIALEELHHRQSFDLDFHTTAALLDVRPLLAEIERAFPEGFEIVEAPDEFGGGFSGVLALPGGAKITVEVRANYEDVPEADLVACATAPQLRRVSLARYLADKIQCLAERTEARDLLDVLAILKKRPATEGLARQLVASQDAALLTERLLSWSDENLAKDLEAYAELRADEARQARDLLLGWLKEQG